MRAGRKASIGSAAALRVVRRALRPGRGRIRAAHAEQRVLEHMRAEARGGGGGAAEQHELRGLQQLQPAQGLSPVPRAKQRRRHEEREARRVARQPPRLRGRVCRLGGARGVRGCHGTQLLPGSAQPIGDEGTAHAQPGRPPAAVAATPARQHRQRLCAEGEGHEPGHVAQRRQLQECNAREQ